MVSIADYSKYVSSRFFLFGTVLLGIAGLVTLISILAEDGLPVADAEGVLLASSQVGASCDFADSVASNSPKPTQFVFCGGFLE